MNKKWRYGVESVIAMAVLAVAWLIYNHYILTPINSGGSVIDNHSYGIWWSVVTVVGIIAGLGLGYSIVKYINHWFNKRSASAVISSLAYDLCRLYLDDMFIIWCRRFGIEMSYDSIIIKAEVMINCSLHGLAKLVCCVFNKNVDAGFDFNKIFYSLADLMIDTWSKDQVAVFVHYLYLENIILGEQIKYAVDRQIVHREALAFNGHIENRLAELDKLHEAESLATMSIIDERFVYASYLLAGGSTVKNWLKQKLALKRFLKLRIVK